MATFCFIVTRDLVKEELWRSWFADLDALGFKYSIVTHCSNPSHILSPWLRATLIPVSIPTSWQFHTRATLALYHHAFDTTESEWFTLHSESCVPIVSAARFVELFETLKYKTILSHQPIWWDANRIARANLAKIPEKFRVAHSEWCILTRSDLNIILIMAHKNKDMMNIMMAGPAADESMVGVCLAFYDRLKDAVVEHVTLVDWKRSPNGNNPYTFNIWTVDDDAFVKDKRTAHPLAMFMRKIGPEVPDHILKSMWSQ